MRTDDLDYELPERAIAQTPATPRDSARLLVDRGPGHQPADATVAQLHQILVPGDLLVLNETRVLPARVAVRRDSGGEGEVLLLEPTEDGWWEALCRPSRKLRVGEVVHAAAGDLAFEVGDVLGDGRRSVRPLHDGDLLDALDALGRGAAAALHPRAPRRRRALPDRLLPTLRIGGGADGRSAPDPRAAGPPRRSAVSSRLRSSSWSAWTPSGRSRRDRVEDHVIHSEQYRVPEDTWRRVGAARSEGRRVVAVGTTSVRALESVGRDGRAGRVGPRCTSPPGSSSRSVDVLLTNFHLPRSSLLAMIEAFVGARWRDAVRDRARRVATASCPSATPCCWGPSRELDGWGREGRHRGDRPRRHGPARERSPPPWLDRDPGVHAGRAPRARSDPSRPTS